MAGFVYCNSPLLIGGHHLRLLLQSADDTVHGIQEVLLAHALAIATGCYKCSLVAHIGYVCTREPWGLTGQQVYVYSLVGLHWFQVHLEYLLALIQVGQIHVDLSVEAAGTQQCLVKHVGTVGGSQDYHTAVGAKAVHLGEQGVEGVLALIVATHGGVLRTGTAHGVYLVDEDDTGRFLLCLAEEVAHTTGTYTYKHLNEVAAAHREEGYTGLASHGLGQQRLTSARRTHEQCSLGYLATQVCVFLRTLQKVYYLLHLLLGTLLSGHILEGDA